MLDKQKAACLVEIGDAVGNIFRQLFLLLNGGLTDDQQEAINRSIDDFARCEQNAIHNLRKAFE